MTLVTGLSIESKPTRNVNDIVLANIPLAPGQAAKLVVVLLEGGGGTSKPWQEIGAAVLATIPTNVTQAIGAFVSTISQFITFADSDDYLGSFEITISNDAGSITSQWRPLEHSKQISESDPPPGRNGFRFDGDGSNYYGWGFVKP